MRLKRLIDKRIWGIKEDFIVPKNAQMRIEILKADRALSLHIHPLDIDEIYIFKTPGNLYFDFKKDI
ncbi:unnamed protein product, partial [marine sediment metagenome]